MATKLDELSVAIGALQEGQRRAEISRLENAEAMQQHSANITTKMRAHEKSQLENFALLTAKIEDLTKSIDDRVEKSSRRYFQGALGGAGIIAAQYVASRLGITLPGGS